MTEKSEIRKRAEMRREERDTSEGIHRKSVTVSHHKVYRERERERYTDGER